MLISTNHVSFGCQTAIPGPVKAPGQIKEKNQIERGGRAGGRHESAFGPEGLTRMLR